MDEATTILVSRKETRFHIQNPVYEEVRLISLPPPFLPFLCTPYSSPRHPLLTKTSKLDIDGLNITVTSSNSSQIKAKGKARAEGLEILTNATLKLKAGVQYALIGRNGTGKSTILKAIAEKLIPGIPLETRISILQQTVSTDESEGGDEVSGKEVKGGSQVSVLEEVIDKATSRSEIQQEVDGMSFCSKSFVPN